MIRAERFNLITNLSNEKDVITLEELAERAVRFGEDCYVEGIIPIQKVKRLAAFYLQEDAPEKMEQAQAMQQIEECLQKNTEEEVKEKTEEK